MDQYTLFDLRNRVSSLPVGGYITVDSRLDGSYIDYLIHSARAFICCERWKQYGEIPASYYQTYSPDYNKAAQDTDACYTVFYDIPQIIALDGRASGLGYVGAINDIKYSFREVANLAELSSFQQDRIMKSGRKAYVLMGQNSIRIYYKDKIKMFQMNAIFFDPTQVPTYNVDFDVYPMDGSDIPKMETYLMQGSMGLSYRTPINRVNDARDVTVPPQVRQ